MASLYDSADLYDLFEDEQRYQVYKNHWQKLFEGKQITNMLDVSIGSGSVTIPVTDFGIHLYGSDLNEHMLANCKKKLDGIHASAILKQSDFRNLDVWGNQQFDIVCSTGNSLGYVNNQDVLKTIEEMDKHVLKGKYLYIDSRNWERILRLHQRFYLYNPLFKDDTRVNIMQVWDYNPDKSMTFNILYTFEKENQIYHKEKFDEHYYPFTLKSITEKLKELEYENIQLHSFPSTIEMTDFNETDWYSIIAQKAS